MSLRILGLIPARGGSKGVPDKNIRSFGGSSLIQIAHQTAIASKMLDRVILSTDSAEIAELGLSCGMDVPFIRPGEFATDQAPMIGVVQHALSVLQKAGDSYDAVFLLQPTSPLRRLHHITSAVDLLMDNDSVCSVVPIPITHCPHYVMKIDVNGNLDFFLPDSQSILRRQDVPKAYTREGTVFLASVEVLNKTGSFYGASCRAMILDPSESMSIDSEADWNLALERYEANNG